MRQNQSPVDGRQTTMASAPSPARSSSIATSPWPPHRLLSAPVKLLDDISQYHVPSVGRQTTRSLTPSPSRSPLSGTSPTLPLPHDVADAPDVVEPLIDEEHVHAPVDGRQIGKSVRLSPSKSGAGVAGTGRLRTTAVTSTAGALMMPSAVYAWTVT